jgi:hypothetical protein
MTFPADNIIAHHVRRLSSVGPELIFEAIRRILWIAGVVRIIALLAIKVQRTIRACHERAVDWNLVQIDSDSMVLCITIEKHTKLKQGVRAILNSRDHRARGKSSLFDIAVKILGVLVEDKTAKLM